MTDRHDNRPIASDRWARWAWPSNTNKISCSCEKQCLATAHWEKKMSATRAATQPPFRIGAGMVGLPRPALKLCFDQCNNHVSGQNLPDTPGKASAAGHKRLLKPCCRPEFLWWYKLYSREANSLFRSTTGSSLQNWPSLHLNLPCTRKHFFRAKIAS